MNGRFLLRGLTALCALAATSCAGAGPARPAYVFETQARPVLARFAPETSGPQMFFTPSGHLYLLAGRRTSGKTALDIYVSKDGGDSFDEKIPVAPASANAMTMGEMSPILVQDPAGPSMAVLYQGGDGDLYVGSAYLFARKFPRPAPLVRKSTPSENGFATMALSPSGTLYAAWLDGRASDRNPHNTFSIYVARSKNGGRSFDAGERVDRGTCPCCRPAFAFGTDGTAYVAWRKDFPGNYRDIVVSSARGDGRFSAPVRVSRDGWSLDGCPDSGPTMTVADGRLYVAWYTQGPDGVPQVRVAHSDDGAAHFSSAVAIPGSIQDINHPKFVAGAKQPLLVFQGRSPGGSRWNPVSAFLASVDGDGVSQPEAIPTGDASLSDPIAVAADADTIYVAADRLGSDGSSVVLARGRKQ